MASRRPRISLSDQRKTRVSLPVWSQYIVYDEQFFKAAIDQMSRAEVVYELTHVFGLKEIPGCLIRIRDDGVLVNHSNNPNMATNNATARTLRQMRLRLNT